MIVDPSRNLINQQYLTTFKSWLGPTHSWLFGRYKSEELVFPVYLYHWNLCSIGSQWHVCVISANCVILPAKSVVEEVTMVVSNEQHGSKPRTLRKDWGCRVRCCCHCCLPFDSQSKVSWVSRCQIPEIADSSLSLSLWASHFLLRQRQRGLTTRSFGRSTSLIVAAVR